MLQSVIINRQILVLMQQVINFELLFRERHIFTTELIFQFDQSVLKINPAFSLMVQLVLESVFDFFELLAFVLEHVLHLAEVGVVLMGSWVRERYGGSRRGLWRRCCSPFVGFSSRKGSYLRVGRPFKNR